MLQFTPFHSVIHSILGEGAASWGVLFEHKKLVELAEKSDIANQAAEAAKLAAEVAASTVVSHSHDSSHAHTECTDPTHDHSHDASLSPTFVVLSPPAISAIPFTDSFPKPCRNMENLPG